jgi:hypothetical protein
MQPVLPLALNECSDSIKKNMVDVYGWTGSISVIIAYALTTFKIDQLLLIDILNLYGSLAIGYICYRGKVWQAVVCEIIWFGVGSYSIIKHGFTGYHKSTC